MSTIKDVANLANVSIATVSRVLNSSDPVSPALEQRVLDAVKKLSYQPNKMARNLRRSESLTTAVLIPDNNNPFFSEVVKGVEGKCFEEGYSVVLCNTNGQHDKAVVYLDTLYQQRIAGLIAVNPGQILARLQPLLERGYPIVAANRSFAEFDIDSVSADQRKGASQAIQHLIRLGHQRIGFVVGERHLGNIQARWTAVEAALEAAGFPVESNLIYEHEELLSLYEQADFLPQFGYTAAEHLLTRHAPPTALVTFNDMMAVGVLHYAQTHGWSIPERLSVISFDDIVISAYTVPALTTVAQPKYELGQRAAEVLIARLQVAEAPPQNIILPTNLIVRDSCGPPAV